MPDISLNRNQAFKKYKHTGGTLTYVQWVVREQDKIYSANGEDDNLLLISKPINDSVQAAIKNTLYKGGLKTTETGKTVFGINKTVFIGGAVIVTAAIIFLIAKNRK